MSPLRPLCRLLLLWPALAAALVLMASDSMQQQQQHQQEDFALAQLLAQPGGAAQLCQHFPGLEVCQQQLSMAPEKRKSAYMRFGKRKSAYMRFGKRSAAPEADILPSVAADDWAEGAAPQQQQQMEKRKSAYMRFGKRKSAYMRFGRK